MKRMRAGGAAIVAALALMLTTPAGETQQSSQFPQPGQTGGGASSTSPSGKDTRTQMPHADDGMSDTMAKAMDKQISSANAARQKQIVADTEKLLALAQQLKVDVDKSSKDTLSLEVIKKADEIERLAHTVKEKMKN